MPTTEVLKNLWSLILYLVFAGVVVDQAQVSFCCLESQVVVASR